MLFNCQQRGLRRTINIFINVRKIFYDEKYRWNSDRIRSNRIKWSKSKEEPLKASSRDTALGGMKDSFNIMGIALRYSSTLAIDSLISITNFLDLFLSMNFLACSSNFHEFNILNKHKIE